VRSTSPNFCGPFQPHQIDLELTLALRALTDPRISLFSASSVQHSSGVVISPVAPADPVVTGGRIWTQDPARPWAEALAATNGLIAAVGDAAGRVVYDVGGMHQSRSNERLT
jgi:hypothetical protein